MSQYRTDDKARKFREVTALALARNGGRGGDGWDDLADAQRDEWRARYEAARKFFEGS